MSESDRTTEDLLRELAPQVLGAVTRRYGRFGDAEDAVQEALLAAADAWPSQGVPDSPVGWLVRVASRRVIDQLRRDDARRRREDQVLAWSMQTPAAGPAEDDSLLLLYLCCHPALSPSAAIPLTLRAVGGLTTREIASAFLVPEPTMAQRISRAKATLRSVDAPFALPDDDDRAQRLASVCHVLYLLFNEGHTASSGSDLTRADLSAEAIRLARLLHRSLPDEPEVGGLLALLLLTDARRPARTGSHGELVDLADQDRTRWDRAQIAEGLSILTTTFGKGPLGAYQLQAAIAGLHDEAPSSADTRWAEVAALYALLEQRTGNPMAGLSRAVAVAEVEGPSAGLALLDDLADRVGDHHRWHAVRGHLLEGAGDLPGAAAAFATAASRATNARERDHLTLRAARLAGA